MGSTESKGGTGAEPTKTLTAADILGADDVKIVPVPVPEWGGLVHVRSMDGVARDRFDVEASEEDGTLNTDNWRSRLLVLTMCKEDGTLLFRPEDVARLAKKSAAALMRVYGQAKLLNKVGVDEVAAEKKDSAGTPSGDSPTGSVSPPAAPPSV